MSRNVTIALDAMSGDRGPDAVLPAALAVLEKDDSADFLLVGLKDTLKRARCAERSILPCVLPSMPYEPVRPMPASVPAIPVR